MFNLLTMLLLTIPDTAFEIVKKKAYCSRYKYHDSFTNQDITLRLYYDLDVNPLAASQVGGLIDDVTTVTLVELQDISKLVLGCELLAQVTQL